MKHLQPTLLAVSFLEAVLVAEGFLWCDTGELQREKGKVAVLENKILNIESGRDRAWLELGSCKIDRDTLQNEVIELREVKGTQLLKDHVMKEKKLEITALKKRVEDVEAELDDEQKESARLNKKLAEAELVGKENSKLKRQLTECDAKIESMNSNAEETKSQLSRVQVELEMTKGDLANKRLQLHHIEVNKNETSETWAQAREKINKAEEEKKEALEEAAQSNRYLDWIKAALVTLVLREMVACIYRRFFEKDCCQKKDLNEKLVVKALEVLTETTKIERGASLLHDFNNQEMHQRKNKNKDA